MNTSWLFILCRENVTNITLGHVRVQIITISLLLVLIRERTVLATPSYTTYRLPPTAQLRSIQPAPVSTQHERKMHWAVIFQSNRSPHNDCATRTVPNNFQRHIRIIPRYLAQDSAIVICLWAGNWP